MATVGLLR